MTDNRKDKWKESEKRREDKGRNERKDPRSYPDPGLATLSSYFQNVRLFTNNIKKNVDE